VYLISPDPETLAVKLSLQFTLLFPDPETLTSTILDFKLAASISPEPESFVVKLSALPFK
jgi:hypothetical protein